MINRNKKDLCVGWVEHASLAKPNRTRHGVGFRAETQPTDDEIFMLGHLIGHDIRSKRIRFRINMWAIVLYITRVLAIVKYKKKW